MLRIEWTLDDVLRYTIDDMDSLPLSRSILVLPWDLNAISVVGKELEDQLEEEL